MELSIKSLSLYITVVMSVVDSNYIHTENTDPCSNIKHVNTKYYMLHKEINIPGIPADMSVEFKTGTIYFTIVHQMKMSINKLKPSGDVMRINTAHTGQSTAVDNTNDVIYLATEKGVYIYNKNETTTLYTAKDDDVMYITVSERGDTIYIATFPQNRVTKITNHGNWYKTFHLIPSGKNIIMDNSDNIYFFAAKITYILKNGEKVPIKIVGLPENELVNIFVAKTKEVYTMAQNSDLYLIDSDNVKANKLGSFGIENVNTFAMNSDNDMYIGVNNLIYVFKAYDKNPCV